MQLLRKGRNKIEDLIHFYIHLDSLLKHENLTVFLKCNFDLKHKKVIFFFLAKPCSLWDLSSPTRDQLLAPAVKVLSPNPWTTREFPKSDFFFNQRFLLISKKLSTLRVWFCRTNYTDTYDSLNFAEQFHWFFFVIHITDLHHNYSLVCRSTCVYLLGPGSSWRHCDTGVRVRRRGVEIWGD